MDDNRNRDMHACEKIFPDEEDSEEEREECTKFTADENDATCSTNECAKQEERPEYESLPMNLRHLQDWKSRSPLFHKCVTFLCDPLGRFTSSCSNVVCHQCNRVLSREMRKFCLSWSKKELSRIIVDFIYFHAIRLFDSEAETIFLKENPSHPYLVGYTRVKEINKLVADRFCTMWQFTMLMRAAVEQTSQMYRILLKTRSHSCEVCGQGAMYQFVLVGRKYNRRDFKLLKRIKGAPRKWTVYLCYLHSTMFKDYFYLRHMDWLVHWNCWHWICCSVNEDTALSAEELINSVSPLHIKKLGMLFMNIYLHMDHKSYSAKKVERGTPSSFFQWFNLVRQWKCSIIYQLGERKAEKEAIK